MLCKCQCQVLDICGLHCAVCVLYLLLSGWLNVVRSYLFLVYVLVLFGCDTSSPLNQTVAFWCPLCAQKTTCYAHIGAAKCVLLQLHATSAFLVCCHWLAAVFQCLANVEAEFLISVVSIMQLFFFSVFVQPTFYYPVLPIFSHMYWCFLLAIISVQV